MPSIVFNAFGFLQDECRKRNIPYQEARIEVPDGETVSGLLARLGIPEDIVEGVFINGRIMPFSTVLKDNDRVALVPPGTPGPHRFLLGISTCKQRS
ncbi:MoaD/ThiS family protein [Thermodesulforhabdus norvegica]|uniref:Sulfur carrier protein ThiS (Thiamine biosynthesis) n=1 Tax=Thermodesulforhabdus norvegica TaxID=39841 RepID=A0A1I4UQE0_9BACT|nr:MoaD/ThiS family protein [Thermodesulforhabdus norvegica]SFM91158.1 Sulfur carrier protein ThiS (thiamine biosynthesis) [Thermodesulforhabdus norvegica]